MNDASRFETRLTDAIERYADRVPVHVDADRLVGSLVSAPISRQPRRSVFGRGPVALAVVAVVAISLAGLALFGGRLLAPVPPVVVSPSPTAPAATAAPTATASPSQAVASATPVPRPSPFVWTSRPLPNGDTLSNVDDIWRVGDTFVAVVSPKWEDGIDPHVTSFLRSGDGMSWEAVPAPARGVEIDTGVVEDGVLWLIGNAGSPEDPRRGIWKTRDGESWERVKNLRGLDFGAGFIRDLAHSAAGWLALAYRRLDVESSVPELYRSSDGVRWAKAALPDDMSSFGLRSLASDGERWIITVNESRESDTQVEGYDVWAFSSVDGVTWLRSPVAATEGRTSTGLPVATNAADMTSGTGGLVIVGQHVEGEIPDPVAWRSADGTTWTAATMDPLPRTAGDTGLDHVIATDSGYLAVGYREEEIPTFWVSPDGLSWTQTEDGPDLDLGFVASMAASPTRVVTGGQLPDGTAFIWSAPLDQ